MPQTGIALDHDLLHALIRTRLTGSECSVLLAVLWLAEGRTGHSTRIPLASIQRITGIQRSNAYRVLRSLRERNIISKSETGTGKRASAYSVNPDLAGWSARPVEARRVVPVCNTKTPGVVPVYNTRESDAALPLFCAAPAATGMRSGRATDPVLDIFLHWQHQDGLIRHRQLKEDAVRLIRERLRDGYSPADLKAAITRYAELCRQHRAPGYNQWTLANLMGRERGGWIDRLLDPAYAGIARDNGRPDAEKGHGPVTAHNLAVLEQWVRNGEWEP